MHRVASVRVSTSALHFLPYAARIRAVHALNISQSSAQQIIHIPNFSPKPVSVTRQASVSMSTVADQPFVIQFYSRSKFDDRSIPTLDETLAFTDTQLERKHDYIQYLFPLPERSPINPDAPILTARIRFAFFSDASLQNNLLAAFERMAAFYGFRVEHASTSSSDVTLSRLPQFKSLAEQTWRVPFDHNHLRITRIIRCLRILGLEDVANVFYTALEENTGGKVNARSLMFWQRAAKRALWLRPDEENENAKGVEWLR